VGWVVLLCLFVSCKLLPFSLYQRQKENNKGRLPCSEPFDLTAENILICCTLLSLLSTLHVLRGVEENGVNCHYLLYLMETNSLMEAKENSSPLKF
jgi:hypothetical protein